MVDYLGEELASILRGDTITDDLATALAASLERSYHNIDDDEYAALLGRMQRSRMVRFRAWATRKALGVFGIWKEENVSQRLLVDGRPANPWVAPGPFESTTTETLTRLIAPIMAIMLAAKLHLTDAFHSCDTPPPIQELFPLRPVKASALRRAGMTISDDEVDIAGRVHPH